MQMPQQPSICVNADQVEKLIAAYFPNVPDSTFRTRIIAQAASCVRADERCWRPASASDFAGEEKKAEREAWALGRPCHVATPNAGWKRRLQAIAGTAQMVCLIVERAKASGETGAGECSAALSERARRLVEKANHMAFADIEIQALDVTRTEQREARERAMRVAGSTRVLPDRTIEATRGGRWVLCTSTLALTEAGARLRNCWAPDRPYSARYQDYLRTRRAEFWVFCARGSNKPTRALMLDLASNALTEVRGVCNVEVSPADRDIRAFMIARGCGMSIIVLNTRVVVDISNLEKILEIIKPPPPKKKD